MLKNPVLETKGIWKGYEEANRSYCWILKELNLELMEGEFISILGKPASGKTTLLNILSFLKFPDKGEVYFQGRLVGKSGAEELKHMHNERVWLFEHILTSNQIAVAVEKKLAAVLLDEPTGLLNLEPDNFLLKSVRYLNSCGIAVVTATKDPVTASHATSIYKLSEGKIEKLPL